MTEDPVPAPSEGDVGDTEPRESKALKSPTVTDSARADGCSLSGAPNAHGKAPPLPSIAGLAIAIGAIARRRRH